MSAIDKNCTFLIANEKSGTVLQEEICKDLESNDINNKIRYELIAESKLSIVNLTPFNIQFSKGP